MIFFLFITGILPLLLISACVSSTLKPEQADLAIAAPVEAVEAGQLPELQTQNPVATGTPTALQNSNSDPQPGARQMSEEQRLAIMRQLWGEAVDERTAIGDSELADKQAAMRRLQNRGNSHYKDALRRIER